MKLEERKEIDIQIIKRTFADVKQFVVGTSKKGSPNVRITKVYDVHPFFEFIPNRMILTIFDHDIKEYLHPTLKQPTPFNDVFLMKNFAYENSRAFAIYSKSSDHPLVSLKESPENMQIVLGRADYLYKREYDYYINTETNLKHNLLIYLKDGKARYIKPKSILIMNKKKPSERDSGVKIPQKITVEARGYGKEEIAYKNKRFEEIGV